MKIVVVGGPRTGKSTYARTKRLMGIPTFCCDPRSLVKEPEESVTYLPEGLSWSQGSQFVADHWMSDPGDACIEGVATVRALRKLLDKYYCPNGPLPRFPQDMAIILKEKQYGEILDGQARMAKGVKTVWDEIYPRLAMVKNVYIVTP